MSLPSRGNKLGLGGWIRRIVPETRRWLRAGSDLLLPPRCSICLADLVDCPDEVFVCHSCRNRVLVKGAATCARCGAIAPENKGDNCNFCHGKDLRFDGVIALGPYSGELRNIILRMKYEAGAPLAAAMAGLLFVARMRELTGLECDLVAPIPMYWTRRLWRKTSNPDTLAHELGWKLGVPSLRGTLLRCRNTILQRDLTPQQRFQNMAGAFRTRPTADVRGRHVLLVDDVLTSGATASEAAKVLKHAGAARVTAAVIARAHTH